MSNGSYFAVLKSTIYPTQATLISVAGDTSITLTKRPQISYATAYGEIFGPADFSNASVAAYQNNVLQKLGKTDSNGYYILTYLPEGQYDLVFDVPGFGNATVHAYLPLADFTEVDANIARAAPIAPAPAASEPSLSSPPQVQQSSIITVTLTKGGSPLAGETIIAVTPAGKTELSTDSQGTARINAAQSGIYMFTYGKLSSSTVVPPPSATPAQPSVPSQPSAPEAPQPQSSSPAAPSGASVIIAAVALFCILLFVGFVVLLVWAKIVSPALSKEKRREKHMHPGHEHHAMHHEEMKSGHHAHEIPGHKKGKHHGKK